MFDTLVLLLALAERLSVTQSTEEETESFLNQPAEFGYSFM